MKKRNKMLALSLTLSSLLLVGCAADQQANLNPSPGETTKVATIANNALPSASINSSKKTAPVSQTVNEAVTSKVENNADTKKDSKKNTQKDSSKDTTLQLIDEAKAKDLALTHADLTDSDITFVKVKLDHDDGRQVYEVEFYDSSYTEYDYEIDASTGKILDFDRDAEDFVPPVKDEPKKDTSNKDTSNKDTSDKNKSEKPSTISKQAAKDAALAHAGVNSSDVSFVKVKLDREDGRQVYEVEFYDSNYTEYDYEIDALTGKVLDFDRDAEDYVPPVKEEPKKDTSDKNESEKPSTISKQAAKDAALAHAGVSGSDASFVKVKLDREDGRQVYEVEFYDSNYTEYDYEIDALTGEVLDFDRDAEDYVPPVKDEPEAEISKQQAKEIAVSQVPGATTDNIREFETDRDDGRLTYEGSLRYNGVEYEFEIDGSSGKILSWEIDD